MTTVSHFLFSFLFFWVVKEISFFFCFFFFPLPSLLNGKVIYYYCAHLVWSLPLWPRWLFLKIMRMLCCKVRLWLPKVSLAEKEVNDGLIWTIYLIQCDFCSVKSFYLCKRGSDQRLKKKKKNRKMGLLKMPFPRKLNQNYYPNLLKCLETPILKDLRS